MESRPSSAAAAYRDGASRPDALPVSPCGPGSHVFACGGGCLADRFSSSLTGPGAETRHTNTAVGECQFPSGRGAGRIRPPSALKCEPLEWATLRHAPRRPPEAFFRPFTESLGDGVEPPAEPPGETTPRQSSPQFSPGAVARASRARQIGAHVRPSDADVLYSTSRSEGRVRPDLTRPWRSQ